MKWFLFTPLADFLFVELSQWFYCFPRLWIFRQPLLVSMNSGVSPAFLKINKCRKQSLRFLWRSESRRSLCQHFGIQVSRLQPKESRQSFGDNGTSAEAVACVIQYIFSIPSQTWNDLQTQQSFCTCGSTDTDNCGKQPAESWTWAGVEQHITGELPVLQFRAVSLADVTCYKMFEIGIFDILKPA